MEAECELWTDVLQLTAAIFEIENCAFIDHVAQGRQDFILSSYARQAL